MSDRGGLKLEKAIEIWDIDFVGKGLGYRGVNWVDLQAVLCKTAQESV